MIMSGPEQRAEKFNAWEVGEPYPVTIMGEDGKQIIVTMNPVPTMITDVWFPKAKNRQSD